MRQASILYKNDEAGILTQYDDGSYSFRYSDIWMSNDNKPSISLTLPKTKQEYKSKYLFPFFFNMLPEGSNKWLICKHKKIDEDDYFSLLMSIANTDSIGAVNVIKIK